MRQPSTYDPEHFLGRGSSMHGNWTSLLESRLKPRFGVVCSRVLTHLVSSVSPAGLSSLSAGSASDRGMPNPCLAAPKVVLLARRSPV